jgi:hypothetical protein
MFQNEEIVTECIRNFEGFSILEETFGPFEIGKKYKIKLFWAMHFIENDILKVATTAKCDSIDVQRYAIGERDDSKLIMRNDPYFLNKIKDFKKLMMIEITKKMKPNVDLDRYNSYTSNIVDSRLLKLLKLSMAELTLEDERRLTNSEKLLYNYLSKIIKVWRHFF